MMKHEKLPPDSNKMKMTRGEIVEFTVLDDRTPLCEMWGFNASTSLASPHAAKLTFHLQSSCPTSVVLVREFL